jgi:hypothetical protein
LTTSKRRERLATAQTPLANQTAKQTHDTIKGENQMSHIVVIESEVRDVEALRAACRRLGIAPPTYQTAKLFSGEATGHCIRLPDWRYPVVCDVSTGKVRYDNFNGRWGHPREFDRLKQAYATEKAKLEARRHGHTVTEQPLADGSIKLTILAGETA